MQNIIASSLGNDAHSHAVCWKSIFAGAVTAAAVSLILLSLSSGIGFAIMSPDAGEASSIADFTIEIAIWMIIMQWFSAGFGGYLTGRLLKKNPGIHDDEVFFRDSAHGFLAWAAATLLMFMLFAAGAASTVAHSSKTTIMMATDHMSPKVSGPVQAEYYTDLLFRGVQADATIADSRMEVTRIFMTDMKSDVFPDADKAYLTQIVSKRAGLSDSQASARVSKILSDMAKEKAKEKDVMDKARESSSAFSIFAALSMMIGAFIAAVTAIIGGTHRNHYLTMAS